jgi:WD40 repeat protein
MGCVTYSPDSSLLLIGDQGADGVLAILDASTNNLLREWTTGQPIRSCAVSVDGSLIATGHDDGTVILWQVE